ncbi:hypothetical protein LLG95_12425 [bacterium]|nr:hypothetical protein [bacterium]
MLCPYCHTDNRDDRELCYHCNRDLTMLRVIVNKAKHHYNQALEFAERDRVDDAIHELQNTIDLDGQMIDAHVVLGTLYAKKEEFQKAREEWNAALAIDHRLLKAHDYLNKAERAEVVFPVIRNLKSLNTALLAIVLVVLIGWATTWYILSKPSKQLDAMSDMIGMLGKTGLGSGSYYRQLKSIQQNPAIPEAARVTAAAMARNTEDMWRESLMQARAALSEGAPVVALNMVRNLRERDPDDAFAAEIDQVQSQAGKMIVARVEDAAKEVAAGKLDPDTLTRIATHARDAMVGTTQAERIEKILARAEEARAQRVLADARDLAAGETAKPAVAALIKMRDANPKLAGQIDRLIQDRVGAEAERIAAGVQATIDKGELDEARAAIADFEALAKTAGVNHPDARIAALNTQIAGAERRKNYEAAIGLYNAKKWEEFLGKSQDPGALAANPVELATLEKMRADALRQFAGVFYDWMNDQDYKFESGSIDAQTAGRVVENWERVYDNMRGSRSAVLFYAAASYHKLGQADRARELIARVRKEYPKAYIQKEVNAFVKKYGKELGIK